MFKIGNNNFKLWVLIVSAIIVGAESQVTCDSSSADCCWVVRSWQLMGKTTSVSPTSATTCCSMTGVTCDSTSKVIELAWASQGLSGSIPAEIGSLEKLQKL